MRDAFGGVFMMRLLLVFIVVLVAFTAISFKYAKSFRVKNEIIDFLEENQVKDLNKFLSNSNNSDKLNKILTSAEYNLSCKNGNGVLTNDANQNVGYCYNGILISKNDAKSHDKTIIYNVYTYVYWDVGFLNTLLVLSGKDRNSEEVIGGVWQISGEAVINY